MANLQSYVRWRGDITFAERPFNVVDNLVLSALSYLDLEGVVPGPGEGGPITVAAAAELMGQRGARPAEVSHRLNLVSETLLADMGHAARYRAALLSDYVDVLDEAGGMQFSAVTVRLADGTAYVAFRGTDNTIMGWQEDVTMSFQVMPAQRFAVDYLTDTSKLLRCPLRIGGHSKGGNLALYSAMRLPSDEQASIIAVYSNDGPGLSPEVQEPAGLQRSPTASSGSCRSSPSSGCCSSASRRFESWPAPLEDCCNMI